MLQTRELSRRPPLSPKGLKVLQDAAPLEDRAVDRLLARTELKLADLEAVQQYKTIARLKRAAASTRAEHAWQALGTAWISSTLRRVLGELGRLVQERESTRRTEAQTTVFS